MAKKGKALTPHEAGEAEALVRHLRADPADESSRAALADWLDEREPTPVTLHKVPPWLRTLWSRIRPNDRGGRLLPRMPVREVVRAMNDVAHGVGLDLSQPVDHWGVTRLGSVSAFASEPYASRDDMAAVGSALTAAFGTPSVASTRAAWNRGCCRLLLLPPAVMPARGRRCDHCRGLLVRGRDVTFRGWLSCCRPCWSGMGLPEVTGRFLPAHLTAYLRATGFSAGRVAR